KRPKPWFMEPLRHIEQSAVQAYRLPVDSRKQTGIPAKTGGVRNGKVQSVILSSHKEAGSEPSPKILIIDDDPELRESLGRLLRSVGLDSELFASVPDFLKSNRPQGPACLALDVRLPGKSGLDFQRELAAANIQVPIIFITGHGDIPMSVQAM